MANNAPKIFVAVAAVLVIAGFIYTYSDDTLFGKFVEPIKPVNWDEVASKYIIEYSIPVSIIEESGNDCKVSAERLGSVFTHGKFTRAMDFANDINFDFEDETAILPCDKMQGDPSELTVWYVAPDSKTHEAKYEYFIDPYDGTLGRGVGLVFDDQGNLVTPGL